MSAGFIQSKQRPIPLEGRRDLRIRRIGYQGVGSWVIKDPVALQYHRLRDEQHYVLQLLDGKRSLDDIRDELQKEYPTLHLTLVDVQHLITDLHEKGLLQSNRPGQGAVLIRKHRKKRWQKVKQTLMNILYLRLPGWDPEAALTWLDPKLGWMFHPWAVTATVTFVSSALLLLAVQFDEFYARLPEFQQFFGWPNLIYIWCVLGMAKVIHEFGHGLSCKHFGGECHSMGIMLLVFSPCMYCDVTDSWMFRNKWKRIAVGGAGMYIEVVLSAIALYVWWFTQPGLLHHLALNLFFVTTVTTVIFNANPLMRFDGYYMLSDFLEIPNMRQKADKLLREKFSWYCLGIESRPDPFMPETGKAWFVTYAIASSIYKYFLVFSIALFLYTVLKPYRLQSIGIALAVASLAGIVVNLVRTLYQIVTAPRSEPMSVPKVTATLIVLGAMIAAGLFIPLPWHIKSPFTVQPHGVQHIYTSTPGRVIEQLVKPGDKVKRGDVLAKLSNPDIEDRYRDLQVQRAVQLSAVETQQALNAPAERFLAEQKLASIDEQLKEYEKQLRELTIVAPLDGTIVAPARVPEPKLDTANSRLQRWHGTPLDGKNGGAFLDARTHLCSIAPNDEIEAVVLVDQADRADVAEGRELELKFEHLPGEVYTGSIATIGRRHLEFAPEPLSNKAGGTLPTVTDAEGRERLVSRVYQATVVLSEDAAMFRPGMRGTARFLIDRRSPADWIWRYIRQTFHFRL